MSDQIVTAALGVLVPMLKDTTSMSAGGRVGAIRALAGLLRWVGSSDGLLEGACRALTSVCEDDEENLTAAGEEGGVRALVAVLKKRGASDKLIEEAYKALCNI